MGTHAPEPVPLDPPRVRAAASPLRVALVNMPWSSASSPSIQCGLLQAVARRAGHTCDSVYLNLEFAARIGGGVYAEIADMTGERLHLLGEWLFSFAAFGETTPDADYLAEFPEAGLAGTSHATAPLWDSPSELRRKVAPEWIEEVASRPVWRSYDVVGFTSTFLQNAASLALGRRLKELHPNLVLVYGGANFDSVMGPEYLRALPWLDHVVSGEADLSFPDLLAAISRDDKQPVAGVTSQRSAGDAVPHAVPVDMDDLPVPDYEDYFQQLERFGSRNLLGEARVTLPLELSRGCWWGQKHHCTFCGLNALGMEFRSKSSSRAMAEVRELLRRYPSVHLDAVDNILDMRYVTSWCADMAAEHWDVNVFFEVKANLDREQLTVLRDAGILRIQPGIESLSTRVLTLMRKGSTSLINVRLLKWAKYLGVDVSWNLLLGFPGEADEDYERQLEIMPLLAHLQPPAGATRVWLERYGPYFEDSSFGFTDVAPKGCYRHIYPDDVDLAKTAYFFDYRVEGTCSTQIEQRLSEAVREWKRRHREQRPSLVYQRLPDRVILIDRRTPDARRLVLDGWQAHAYEECGDSIRSAGGVANALRAKGHHVADEQVEDFLAACCRAGIMLADDGKHLSLALPENPHW